ncbi:MAG: HAMP domain-containing protein [Planctomycetes bacterium]|nr:HAMP domain-containing protein [Planctomycetota bacterium]
MSIQKKLISVMTAVLVVTVFIIGLVNYVQTKDMVADRLYDSELPAIANSIRNGIEKELIVFLTVSQAIADNTYVRDWFKNGESEEGLAGWVAYAKKVQQRTNAFNVSLVSNVTRKYYDQGGYNEGASGAIKFWFDDFIKSNQPYEMVLDKNETTGNKFKMFTNVRVDIGGKLASVGLGIDAEGIAADITAIKVGESGVVYLTSRDGVVKIHKDSNLIGKMNIKESEGISSIAGKLLKISNSGNQATVNLANYESPHGEIIAASSWIPSIQSFVVIEVPADEIFGEITSLMARTALIVLVILLITVLIVFFIARQISQPIQMMTGVMGELANGNTDLEVPVQDQTDEIGEMASAVQVFKDNMIRAEELSEAQRKEDETQKIRAQKIEKLTENFDQAVSGTMNVVSSSATQLEETAKGLTATADQTSQQATAVAAASEEASVNVQTVASATEELGGSISEISRQVEQSATISEKAVEDAKKTNENVQQLAEAADRIGDVVSLITDIAEQTNLLALNATIEAARAGEAGKGFAVVASEVKNLANQTAKATEEISSQIGGIQNSTKEAVSAIDGIGSTIGDLNEIAVTITASVDDQNSATQEIARNIEQASSGTMEVNTNISGVNQAASDTGDAANNVLQATNGLNQETAELRGVVEEFLANIREA